MPFDDHSKLSVVDVGALGGLKQSWRDVADEVIAVLFEPDVEQAKRLAAQPNRFHQTIVANVALGAAQGRRTLNVTKSIGCTSLLTPNREFMNDYSAASAFDIVGKTEVELTTYASLFRSGKVPRPDVIKVDVQGFEYDVLLGFGDLLGSCLAIELETHLHPMYLGQKLFHEVLSLLSSFGFVLRRMKPVDHFDGDIVEMDVWLTAGPRRIAGLNAIESRKLAIIEKEWGIPARRRQFNEGQWDNERAANGLQARSLMR